MLDTYPLDVPDQLTFWPDDWPQVHYVLRRRHASTLHWDLRLRIKGLLYSWWMQRPPSFDPECRVWAELTSPHDPRWMFAERRIPQGQPGAGLTLVQDYGWVMPMRPGVGSQEQRLHDAFLDGKIDLIFAGEALQGTFCMERSDGEWWLAKREDEFASKAPYEWTDLSPLSGLTSSDL